MEHINWPLWIIAFSILAVSAAIVVVLASMVAVLRKIGAAADAVGFAVSQTGSAIRRRFSGEGSTAGDQAGKAGKGSAIRGLSIVSAVLAGLGKVIRRGKPRP